MRLFLFAALVLVVVAHVSPSAATAQTSSTPPVRIGGNIPPPTKTKDVRPVYPPLAQQARVSGVVILEATIGEDGKVRDVVVKRSIPLLDEAALDAVRQWEYAPTLVNGAAAPVIMTVTVNFALQDGPTPAAMIRLTSFRTQDGQSRLWEISRARAGSLPHWTPDTDLPSLTVPEATRIARAWLAGRDPRMQSLEFQSVSLSRVRRPPDVDFWYYYLSFFGRDPSQRGPFIAIVLPDGSIAEPSDETVAASTPASPEPGVYRPGGDVTAPRAIRQVKADYTTEALRRKITGSVIIEGVVGVDGALHDPRVIRSLDAIYGLDNEALKAAAQFQFTPGLRAGQPVPVTVSIEISFYAK
jgi:TonB family protein